MANEYRKRKSIPKKIRLQVFNKFKGHCAYCGIALPNRWHVDHLEPVERGGTDRLSNLMPSCISCNNYKTVFTLEEFRRELNLIPGRLRKHQSTFRIAERFELIADLRNKIIFYFELDKITDG